MPPFRVLVTKPLFILAVLVPIAFIVEFFILEAGAGISLPSDRGSAVSSYEVRERGKDVHFITRNKRFRIVDLWSKNGSAVEALVLRESSVTDRQEGIEGDKSTVTVEALDGKNVKWSFEEPGERGEPINQLYEVTKFGCCASPNTYSYFSLRDGRKLRTTHAELNPAEFAALEKTLYF